MEEIDLSTQAGQLLGLQLWQNEDLQAALDLKRNETSAWVLFGGYLEERALYQSAGQFVDGGEQRTIHLGIDFWASPETAIYAPWDGVIHALQDNNAFHDYGPTLILEHWINGGRVYSLYGHLSRASMKLWKAGDKVEAGHLLAWIGADHENGQWPPHLHFQLIHDLEGQTGDYPGVCSRSRIEHYQKNCPDPRPMLGL